MTTLQQYNKDKIKTDIEEKIEGTLEDINDIEEVEDALKKVFKNVRFVDEKIDDGIDDEDSEDEYVMMRSFDVTENGVCVYLRLYYGGQTGQITYYTTT